MAASDNNEGTYARYEGQSPVPDEFWVLIEKSPDTSGWLAFVPQLGWVTQGETLEELPDLVEEGISLMIEDRLSLRGYVVDLVVMDQCRDPKPGQFVTKVKHG